MRGGVFICHASSDAGVAQRAVTALEAAGVPCWIAPRDIDPGENYTQAILDGLEAAPAIVLVFSAATNASPHVTRELETAVGSGRPIVPVRLEDVEPSRSVRYFIGTSQWLDARGAAGDWTPALVRAVRRAVGHAEEELPTRFLPPEPAPEPRPATSTTYTSSGSGRRAALVGTALVAAVVVGAVLVVALTGDGDGGGGGTDPPAARDAETTSAPPIESESSEPTNSAPESSEPEPRSVAPVPAGRAGMATVFPGLSGECRQVEQPVAGKVEVYECADQGYLVRYTRWGEGADKEAYYDVENQVASQTWTVGGEEAGLQWFSIEDDPAEKQPYQWSAAYADAPFSVSIEAKTSAARSSGVAGLSLRPPSELGSG